MDQFKTTVLIDFYKAIQRQGPGSIKDTLNAFGLTGLSKHEKLQIADIGCGTGGQTLTLAHNTNGQITALDLFPQFLEKLNQNRNSRKSFH